MSQLSLALLCASLFTTELETEIKEYDGPGEYQVSCGELVGDS